LPILIVLVVFFVTIGYTLSKKFFDFPEVTDALPANPQNSEAKEEPKSVVKMYIVVAVLLFCIAGFVLEFWALGVTAMVGAAICIVTGCISQKRVFEKMDWTTVVIMGASFGISNGMQQSGAGALVAQTMVNLLGDNVTPWLLWTALGLLAMVLTNFMSSTATAALLVPIAGLVAIEFGFDVKTIVMGVAIAANAGYATPVSTPPMTMALAGGYRFKDYIKIGGLVNIIVFIMYVLLFPIAVSPN
jgi:di/tricarboxylate transporter